MHKRLVSVVKRVRRKFRKSFQLVLFFFFVGFWLVFEWFLCCSNVSQGKPAHPYDMEIKESNTKHHSGFWAVTAFYCEATVVSSRARYLWQIKWFCSFIYDCLLHTIHQESYSSVPLWKEISPSPSVLPRIPQHVVVFKPEYEWSEKSTMLNVICADSTENKPPSDNHLVLNVMCK